MSGRNTRYHPSSWFGHHVTRKLSPYVTRLFLRLGMSANQASALRLAVALAVAPLFLRPEPWWWIVACLAAYAGIVLDCVDGELARLRGTASPEGTYVDEVTGMASGSALLSGITIGLSLLLGTHAAVFGLGAIITRWLTLSHLHLLRSVAFEWGVPAPARDSARPSEAGWVRRARTVATYLLFTPGLHYLPQLIIASVLDLFVPPFTIFGLAFNVRLLWLAFFALGLLLAAVARARLTVRCGIRSQL
jgi:phosphatidylglycerophosphate synthase